MNTLMMLGIAQVVIGLTVILISIPPKSDSNLKQVGKWYVGTENN